MALVWLSILICTASACLLFWNSYRLFSVLRGTKNATITFSPHKLRLGEIFMAILTMLLKSALKSVRGSKDRTSAHMVEGLTLSSTFSISDNDITQYHRAVGLTKNLSSEIGGFALPLFLSAVTEPAMLLLLTNPRCPVSPLGAVNVRNRFEILRPDLCRLQSFKISNSAGLIARLRNESRSVKRGIEYDLEVSIMVPNHAGSNNAELLPVYRQVFTMLEFSKAKVTAESKAKSERKNHAEKYVTPESSVRMSLSRTDPLNWAALCKDYNFIHVSGFAAKLFGLPGKLAHGNHIVAKAMQKLSEHNKLQQGRCEPTWMEVHFKRPVVVPSFLDVEGRSISDSITEVSITHNGRESVGISYGML